MHNPFTEDSDPDPPDEELVRLARSGSRDALERLVRRHQRWVFNVVVRMVWRTDRAEDVTQEVLVKIVTNLGSFRGDSRFRTWAYRIAANHALNVARSEMEEKGVTFTDVGRELADQPDADLPDPRSVPVELPVLVEEAKVGCTPRSSAATPSCRYGIRSPPCGACSTPQRSGGPSPTTWTDPPAPDAHKSGQVIPAPPLRPRSRASASGVFLSPAVPSGRV
ncbi:MAG TPA: RNA polymerase sigma factor [Gemmataceae bacterium]|nr:RNA polymerase sigma factor [Gemmataceae bacterium]